MSKLRVHKKAYTRKGGTRIKATSFLIKDRGKKGRGKVKIPIKGHIGCGYHVKESSAKIRRAALKRALKKYSYLSLKGKVGVLIQLYKRTNKTYSRRAESDFNWLVKKYGKGR